MRPMPQKFSNGIQGVWDSEADVEADSEADGSPDGEGDGVADGEHGNSDSHWGERGDPSALPAPLPHEV